MKSYLRLIGALSGIGTLIAAGPEAARIVRSYQQVADGPKLYAAQLQALRQDGLPADPSDLQRPPLPAARNAAPDYVALTALLKKHPIPKNIEFTLYPIAEETRAEQGRVRRFLSQRPDLMALIHRAAAKPECDFRRNWKLRWLDTAIDQYGAVRTAERLIRAESYLQALNGHSLQAVSTQALGFRVAEHVGADPMAIAYLVEAACDATVLGGMEDILRLSGPVPEVCKAVRTAVEQRRPRFDFLIVLRGEIIYSIVDSQTIKREGVKAIEPLLTSGPITVPLHVRNLKPLWNDFADANTARVLWYERELAKAAALPEAQRLTACHQAGARAQRLLNQDAHPIATLLGQNLVGILDHLVDKEYEAHAHERVIMAAAAVLAYRGRHGTYPRHLEDVIRTIDPYSQSPLKYYREGAGFVVYSVGPTGAYDGHPMSRGEFPRGIVFRYPQTPAR